MASSSPTQYPPIYVRDKDGFPTVVSESDPNGFLPYNRRIRATKLVVLHWDNDVKSLVEWSWPCIHNKAIKPEQFTDYRREHRLIFPSCLCSMESSNSSAVSEISVYKMPAGRALEGKWVGQCAKSRCHYFLLLDAIYSAGKNSFPIRDYPLRTQGEVRPAPISQPRIMGDTNATPSRTRRAESSNTMTSSPLAESSRAAGKRRRIEVIDSSFGSSQASSSSPFKAKSSGILGSYLRAGSPPLASDISDFTLLLSMDDMGISMSEFRRIFILCNVCHDWVGTASALEKHYCPKRHVIVDGEVIELSDN